MVARFLLFGAAAVPGADDRELIRRPRVSRNAPPTVAMNIERGRTRAWQIRLHAVENTIPSLGGRACDAHDGLPVGSTLGVAAGAGLCDSADVAKRVHLFILQFST